MPVTASDFYADIHSPRGGCIDSHWIPNPNDDASGDAISKGVKGEGSHGGHVIGHTRNGKPIYESHTASHSVYSKYTKNDHRDAGEAHRMKARLHRLYERKAQEVSGERSVLAPQRFTHGLQGVLDSEIAHHRTQSEHHDRMADGHRNYDGHGPFW